MSSHHFCSFDVSKEVWLVRNELDFKIYNFEDGRPFAPDFVLFLRRRDGEEYDNLQIFIEPKGTHLLANDKCKEDFLNQIQGADTGQFCLKGATTLDNLDFCAAIFAIVFFPCRDEASTRLTSARFVVLVSMLISCGRDEASTRLTSAWLAVSSFSFMRRVTASSLRDAGFDVLVSMLMSCVETRLRLVSRPHGLPSLHFLSRSRGLPSVHFLSRPHGLPSLHFLSRPRGLPSLHFLS